jgi:hypothetical protein
MKPELMALIFGAATGGSALAINEFRKIAERREVRRSVRPSLLIKREAGTDKPVRIVLRNIGRGPAYIDSFEIMVDNIPVADGKNNVFKNSLGKLGLNGFDIITYLPGKGEIIKENETGILFESNPIDEKDYDLVDAAFKRILFSVKYRSEYGESFFLSFQIE